jgi:tetratricopeptide (TPR) repeat protein
MTTLMRGTVPSEAKNLCRHTSPDFVARPGSMSMHARGYLAARHRQHDVAIAYLAAAASLDPANALCLRDLGDALRLAQRYVEAIESYQRALKIAPQEPTIYCRLGAALLGLGQLADARGSYELALKIDPDCAAALSGLGDLHNVQREHALALSFYKRAAQLEPREAEHQSTLGAAYLQCGRWQDALDTFREGSRRQPDRADFQLGAGIALLELSQIHEAADAFRTALASDPQQVEACRGLVRALELLHQPNELAGAWLSLATALEGRDEFDQAARAFRQVLTRKPDCLPALVGLGRMHLRARDPRSAIPLFEAALTTAPEHAWAHIYLGWSHGLLGDLPKAWGEIACFFRLGSRRRYFEQPTWNGEQLDGRTVLLWMNAGLGDAIQMLRYAPLVKQRGGRVIMECHRSLIALFQRTEGVDEVVASGAPLPPFDAQAPLSLLPCIFPTTVESIPGAVPYARVDPGLVRRWRQILSSDPQTRTIGLVWSGEPLHSEARHRFAPLAAFSCLGNVPGVRYVSLQLGPAAIELLAPPPTLHVRQALVESMTIHETAAIVMNLDLVITVDTMMAHLAGALAKPVWTMLPYAADWRWLNDGDRSPWYPSMRLFRQRRWGDWHDVVVRMRAALETMTWPIATTPGSQ